CYGVGRNSYLFRDRAFQSIIYSNVLLLAVRYYFYLSRDGITVGSGVALRESRRHCQFLRAYPRCANTVAHCSYFSGAERDNFYRLVVNEREPVLLLQSQLYLFL